MSNTYAFPTHYEDDTSDSLSSIGAKSASFDSIEVPSPYFIQLSEICDIDALSNQAKKIRKKRCAYDKIDDEKRIQLLNAVQKGGESLKSASKRLNINYSSAKSILHTFRKEGRILKKSPLESAVRPFSMVNLPTTSMEISPMNNGSHYLPQKFPSQGAIRPCAGPYKPTNGANSPMRGLTSIFANLLIDNDPVDDEPSFMNMLETSQPKEELILIPKLQVPGFLSDSTSAPSSDDSLDTKEVKIPSLCEIPCNLLTVPPVNQTISHARDLLKRIDNFYMNYSNSPLSGGKGNMFGDCSDSGSRKCGPKEFDSFSDMLTAFQTQGVHNDELKRDFQIPRFCRMNSGQEKSELKLIKEDSTESNGEAENMGFDTQWLLCDGLRKASFLSNLSQFQRPGISLVNERNK